MRRLIAPALAALTLAATPALAQIVTPPIPAVQDRAYPGVIRHEVDITDTAHRVIRVKQQIPVSAGPLTLLYPKFLPGNHAASGPIQLVAGLQVSGNGARIAWTRDPVDPYAFHIDVPAGVQTLDVAFDWLTQPDGGVWRVVMTPEIVNLQFDKALLYPAGYPQNRITFETSVRLPAGWNYGVALDTVTRDGDVARFAPVSLEVLADSPMFAGAHYRQVVLDAGPRPPVRLNMVGDTAQSLAITEEQTQAFRNLVTQSDRLFGARHFDRYDFLLALTSKLGGIGLEHHRSSENTGSPNLFGSDWARAFGGRRLLPHEFTHSWNGKYRRPVDQMVPNLNTPVRNSLLWVYEGQTEYWGTVLQTRSGLGTLDETMADLAQVAAFYDTQPGREWRPLQDTTNNNLLGYRIRQNWPSWMRGTGDYYRESELIWLDADTLIREGTRDRKSLDDFARAFFGGEDGTWTPKAYDFDELVATLNSVHPHDWATFLRTRLDAVGPDAEAPLDGLARGGWRLVYADEPTEALKRIRPGWESDFSFSLGFTLSGANNAITGVRWGGPAYRADIGDGWELVAVNGRVATPALLRQAVLAAKTGGPLDLIIKSGDRVRTVSLDYRDGPRHARLERIEGTRDRISEIMAPRRR